MKRLILSAILLCICLSACTSTAPPGYPIPPQGTVTHVVLVWLKNPGNEQDRQKLIDTSHTFEQIPGVLLVTAGKALPSTRPIVDSSFDVAVMILFSDEQSLKEYEDNPIHRQAVQDVLKPLSRKIQIYDSIQ